MTVSISDKVTGSSLAITAREVIRRSLIRLNIYSIRDSIPSDEINDGLVELNSMFQLWFLSNIVSSFNPFLIDDNVDFDIGVSNKLSFSDVVIDNLSIRLIELYNLNPQGFGTLSARAKTGVNILTNLKRTQEVLDGTFKSEFDSTLSNTPDIARRRF